MGSFASGLVGRRIVRLSTLLALCLVTFSVLLSVPPVPAVVVSKTIYATQDTFVYEGYPDKNYGDWVTIYVGIHTNGNRYRGFIYFPLSAIPSNAVIVSAYLKLTLKTKYYVSTKQHIWILAVKDSWSESTVTWNNQPSHWSDGPGSYGSYGDFWVDAADSAGKVYTVSLKTLVEKWVSGAKPNRGIWMSGTAGYTGVPVFHSSESSSTNSRPKLVITYKVPMISLSVSPSSASTSQGGSVTYQVSVTPSDYAGTVTLSASNLPPGASYSFNPPSGSGSFSSILTIATSSSTPPGTYTIKVKATGTGVSAQKTVKLKVLVSGTFGLSLSPPSVTVPQGGSTSVQVLSTASGGYSGTITLSLLGVPSDVTMSFTSTTITAGSSTVLNIQVSNTAATGTYTVIVRGKGTGGIVQDVPLQLVITTAGYFELTLGMPKVTLTPGASADIRVTVVPHGGYSNPVTLSVTTSSSDITATLASTSVNPGDFTRVKVSVSPTASPGTYTVTVEGTGPPGLTDDVQLTVVVEKPFDFSLSASQSSITANAGDTVTVTITVNLVSGSPKPVSLSLTGLPAGSYSFSPATVTPTGTSTLTINTAGLSGPYSIVVKGTHGGVERTTTISLSVTSFDFSVSVTPSSLEMNQGESATVVVNVKLVSGSPQPVRLGLMGLPPGVSYTFSPPTVTPPGSSSLVINAGSAKGAFTVIVRARGGSKERTATFRLVIKEKRCIIATVTYGSEVSSEVQFLREFRDNIVLSTVSGSKFYKVFDAFYYSWSPAVAAFVLEHPELRPPLKMALYPLIASLKAAALAAQPLIGVSPEAAVYLAGTVASALLGLVYLAPVLYLLLRRAQDRSVERLCRVLACTAGAALVLSALSNLLGLTDALLVTTPLYVVSVIALVPTALVRFLISRH